ncbi:hypothetical protein EKE94_03850 [Mesobaculum littorinae]|uniref:C4-dicarboxylate ABC transporter substrate-binding protein n=1 Tax=Mesobaculum littorinae TaxID=2486419 RepID=A0A438AMH6_9RHOB|nr:hypothetical protein [Mesobaculum littorinae]RVV99815.1 hypothetical protein EKE94_03850 [Mesobaculum littorinae]
MKRLLMAALLTGAATLPATAPATATELVYGSWLGVTNKTNTDALVPYFDMVAEATGGDIQWEMIGGSQLANASGTPEAVGANMMDAGLVMAPYQPRMLPATNLIFSQSLVGEDLLASVGAMNETLMLHCDECHAEFAQNDAVGFAGYGVSPYLFMCRGGPRTIDDLRRMKIRGSGGGVAIIETLGGTPISMTGNEFTAAMERGALDCVLGSVQWLVSFGLMDVTDTVIDAPMGMGGPPIMMYVNRGVWEDMTPEQRQAHIDHAPDLVSMATFDVQIPADEAAVSQAKEQGITFIEGGPEYDAVMSERDATQYDLNIGNARDAGVEAPEPILDAYLASFDRWKGLLDDEGRDSDTFRRLLWDEVYSKVDPDAL